MSAMRFVCLAILLTGCTAPVAEAPDYHAGTAPTFDTATQATPERAARWATVDAGGTDLAPVAAADMATAPDLSPVPLVIWPVGDSATKGLLQVGSSYVNSGGYRPVLHDALTAANRSFQFTGTQTDSFGNHDGYPGWWTADPANLLAGWQPGVSDVLSHVPTWAAQVNHHNVAVILIGGNTVKWCFSFDGGGSAPGYPVLTVPACWTPYLPANPTNAQINAFQGDPSIAIHIMATQIKQVVAAVGDACGHTCKEVVVQVTPQNHYTNTIAAINADLSADLAGVPNVVVVDSGMTLADISGDEIHPTTVGYAKIGAAVFKALQ